LGTNSSIGTSDGAISGGFGLKISEIFPITSRIFLMISGTSTINFSSSGISSGGIPSGTSAGTLTLCPGGGRETAAG